MKHIGMIKTLIMSLALLISTSGYAMMGGSNSGHGSMRSGSMMKGSNMPSASDMQDHMKSSGMMKNGRMSETMNKRMKFGSMMKNDKMRKQYNKMQRMMNGEMVTNGCGDNQNKKTKTNKKK